MTKKKNIYRHVRKEKKKANGVKWGSDVGSLRFVLNHRMTSPLLLPTTNPWLKEKEKCLIIPFNQKTRGKRMAIVILRIVGQLFQRQ